MPRNKILPVLFPGWFPVLFPGWFPRWATIFLGVCVSDTVEVTSLIRRSALEMCSPHHRILPLSH